MAGPATITLAVRAAIAAATDKRMRQALGVIIAALLTPFILIVVVIVSLLSATADHNNAAIDLCFNGGAISSRVPADYAAYIRDMRDSFAGLDTAISDISSRVEDGGIDGTRVKAIFYALFFGVENLGMGGSVQFVRYKTTGYGYHLAIDHGGGFVTLYGHCSKILVTEGQTVRAGEIIAQVGSTGRSTGPHLHFETRINGEMKNPRSYLP